MKNVLALLADFANGIFAVLLAGYLIGIEPQWWHFLVGMVCAVSPDVDAVPELLRRGKVAASAAYARDHRTFLHYPIISIPLGILAWFVFGYWGLVVLIAWVLHLLNDMYGTGWGIPALYPFSNKRYKLTLDTWRPAKTSQQAPTPLISSWSANELQAVIVTQGNDNWLADTYLNVNWISVTEYTLFAIALAAMVYSLL